MKNNRNFRNRKGNKNQNKVQKPESPFALQMGLLKKEHFVLVNLNASGAFIDECHKRGMSVGVGGKHNDGIIIYER